ncbi:uncharacterized protein LOC125506516 [Triticum urartu]|uniref:RING-type domain-containing protein n=1 Tax=Triticum urartu TaxID=4572 RepID=A0A8R7URV6_TRIUA|nr:uncharacterized protein LOC125506412 [Triticum urartu]XP_048527275.1 uncharacterized protein LOC125506516 [Triticum urartu]
MSSPPPTSGREQIADIKAPRPHAADTTGAAGDIGAVEANQAVSVGEAKATPSPATICPACTESWSSDGPHRMCCIPCGHVYGRSCMETLLGRSGQNSAKCPQCGKQFEEKLIINLYAPENMLEGCCSPEEIKAFYEHIFVAVRATCIEIQQWFRERVAQMERIVNKKLTMAKANVMLMKERLKKMAEQEKMVPKDMIVFMEQNCPQLMICVSCVFSSIPAPGMEGRDEIANVEIMVREGPCHHAVEASERGGRGNELNHTVSGSGEETDGSYRESSYFGEYNANISNKEANRMLVSANMEASAEGGKGIDAKAPARPTCSICMEPWTSMDEHHICCIPCGHVYGWSCLIRWLRDQLSRNENLKCPQCAENFEGNLINLHAPLCQEVHEYYETKLAEFEASREECMIFAKYHSQYDLLSAQAKFWDELRALISPEIAEVERVMMEHVAKANSSLVLMKEHMKKMAEEDTVTTEHLIGYMEQTCHCSCLFPTLPNLPI